MIDGPRILNLHVSQTITDKKYLENQITVQII